MSVSKRSITVIEGVDRSGKDTLARKLVAHNKGFRDTVFLGNIGCVENANTADYDEITQTEIDQINSETDRDVFKVSLHISNFVYNSIREGSTLLTKSTFRRNDELLEPARIIYLDIDYDTYRSRLDTGEPVIDNSTFEHQRLLFDEALSLTSHEVVRENYHYKKLIDTLDLAQYNLSEERLFHAYNMIKNGKKLITTGVGISGIVAKKLGMSMASAGKVSINLDPTNASHGDLGIVEDGDTIVMISNSGNTAELVTLASIIRAQHRRVKIIVITATDNCKLAKFANVVLKTGITEEIDCYGIFPTASTTAALSICDVLLCEYIYSKRVTVMDFNHNHPGGELGKLTEI